PNFSHSLIPWVPIFSRHAIIFLLGLAGNIPSGESNHSMPALQRYTFKGKQGACLRLADFASQYIRARHVDIWHPSDYDASSTKHYPVIYMHDGQNLFDPALSYIGVDWGVDQAISQLMYARGVVGAIVVGIWNSPLRYLEYMPQRPFERI